MMNIQSYAATDRGMRRETNEDQYFIDESLGLYVVCDGMGGHAAGEVAAERSVAYAVAHIRDRANVLETAAESPDGYFRVLELAEGATQQASRRLHQQAVTEPSLAGMGTTMTMLLIVDNKAVMSHVGDSRLYMLRHGDVHQLSNDHTLANELLLAGAMKKDEIPGSRLSHVLTRTIGQQESVQVETLLFDIYPGDTCLLCSDGLSNYFADAETVAEYLAADDLSTVPDRLVAYANAEGGADNITLIALRATSDEEITGAADFQRRVQALRSTFLCSRFSVGRLMHVLNITSLIECAAGQRVLSAGEKCDGLYVVLDGRLRVDDGELLSGDLLPGDCAGGACLMSPGKAEATVIAETASQLLLIPRSKFGKLTRRLPKLGNRLLRNLSRHLSEELDRVRSDDKSNCGDTATWEYRST